MREFDDELPDDYDDGRLPPSQYPWWVKASRLGAPARVDRHGYWS